MQSALRTVERRWAITKVVRALHELVHAILYDALCSGIDGAGRLVEDQHRRICDGGSGNREQLTLSLA